MYVASLFFLLFGISAIWPLALLIHQRSFFDKMSASTKLSTWEHITYYAIAIYPILSYLALIYADDLFKSSGIAREQVREQFAVYVVCHIVLTILSLTVVRHLIKRSKLNIVFAISSSLAGGMYVLAGIVLMMR